MKKAILIITLIIVIAIFAYKIMTLPKIDIQEYQKISNTLLKEDNKWGLGSVYKTINDSLVNINTIGHRPNYSEMIYAGRDSESMGVYFMWQLNLPSTYSYKLYLTQNTYNEILFPNIELTDVNINFNTSVSLIKEPDNNLILQLINYSNASQSSFVILPKLSEQLSKSEKYDLLSWNNDQDQGYFLMNFEYKDTSEIWIVPILGVTTNGNVVFTNETATPYKFFTIPGKIDKYNIRLISLNKGKIMVIPSFQENLRYTSILELQSKKTKTLNSQLGLDKTYDVLGKSKNNQSVLLAKKEDQKNSSIIGIDASLNQEVIFENLKISYEDIALDSSGENLLFINNSLISKYNLESKLITKEVYKPEMNKIHGPLLRGNNEIYLISSEPSNKIVLLDNNLNGSDIFTMPTEDIKLYDIKLVDFKENLSYQSLILHGASEKFSLINQIDFEIYPNNQIVNLCIRIYNRTFALLSSLKTFIIRNLLLSIIIASLSLFSIIFSLFASRKLLRDRYENIISFVPIPLNFKLMKRLKKYTVRPALVHVAILNVDIVNFSQIVTNNSNNPAILQELVDNFFKLFIEEAFNRGGTIGKIMGDGIVGIFGWPKMEGISQTTIEENCRNALDTALAMQGKELSLLGIEVAIRQGITMGNIYLGHFGNKHRKDYLAIGDAIDFSEVVQKNARKGEIQLTTEVAECLTIKLNTKRVICYKNEKIEVGHV